jgi:hypothetical protein
MSNLERLIIYEITRTSGEDNSQNIDVHVRRQDVDNVDVVPGEQYRKQSDVENYREDEVSERNVEECLIRLVKESCRETMPSAPLKGNEKLYIPSEPSETRPDLEEEANPP